jgi:hypothetical protein
VHRSINCLPKILGRLLVTPQMLWEKHGLLAMHGHGVLRNPKGQDSSCFKRDLKSTSFRHEGIYIRRFPACEFCAEHHLTLFSFSGIPLKLTSLFIYR